MNFRERLLNIRSILREGEDSLLDTEEERQAYVRRLMDAVNIASTETKLALFEERMQQTTTTCDVTKLEERLRGLVNNQCNVCFVSFDDDQVSPGIVLNRCQHVFHKNCVLIWIQQRNLCPLCRQKVYD